MYLLLPSCPSVLLSFYLATISISLACSYSNWITLMVFLFVDSLVSHNNTRFRMVIKSLELLLISAGLISTLLMVKGSLVPYSCELVVSSLVGFWKSCKCFLSSPLYICIVINFMVLLIAASSSFQRHETDDHGGSVDVNEDMQFDKSPLVSQPPAPPPHCQSQNQPRNLEEEEHLQLESNKEEEEEEEDTMEATWRAITGGGKEEAKKKQLKKSETWNVKPPRRTVAIESLDSESEELLPSWKELRKSETFNDSVSIRQRGGLRRDPTMSVDEFNNQVEAFIKKFNDSIRLQRQESYQRFIDMVNRGL